MNNIYFSLPKCIANFRAKPLATAIGLLCGASVATSASSQGLIDIDLPRGFRALELPGDFGGKSLAGSLVQISENRGFRYLGHLSDCGLPARALEVLPSLGADSLVSNRELDVDINLGAKFLKLFSIGVDAEKVSTLRITLGSVVDEMVIPIAVVSAARTHSATLEQRCGSFLSEPNVFWVNNAMKTDSLSVEFLDASGASISASAANVTGVVDEAAAGASVRLGSGNTILINKPVYIAFRDAPPSELLTGDLSLFSVRDGNKAQTLTYGDEVFE